MCKQLCYEGFGTLLTRDESNPCQIEVITLKDLSEIENHKKHALSTDSHLAIYLNAVIDKTTEHFVLKAPNGVDKVHVNKEEVLVTALHYCPQLGSILVGYNFGAFQLWNLKSMELIYTSPICEDHVPISMFAIQEPLDDPRAFCYVWAVYGSTDSNSTLLPYLVMYALCYESKEFHECYGALYENFQYCAVRFHMELGFGSDSVINPKGGKCLRLESLIHKTSNTTNEICLNDGTEDIVSLCVVIWRVVSENGNSTYMAVFDLNQWYKEQMPNSPNFDNCSSYMITLCVTDSTYTIEEGINIYDVAVNKKTLQQFMGTQRMEGHYYPSSLSFDTCCLLENRAATIQYLGVQKALLAQLQSAGPLCLIRPTDIYQEIVSIGLTPLYVENSSSSSSPISLNLQRELILNVALEQQLLSWLSKCASEWANGSLSSAGCSLELLISWAFQRAAVLKNCCDSLCIPLFDYSEMRLDTNTTNILNNSIRQIKNISFFYSFITKNLYNYLTDPEQVSQQYQILQMIELYFDVLQWLFNVGLLPECSPTTISEISYEDRIRAPYPADQLTNYYEKRRSEMVLSLNQHFSSKSSVLFIDNLISVECGGDQLERDWKNDGGDGFYPPCSLQALLRTYLIDGIEVWNKHAVVIYLFLDLAMILDSQKYPSVITHLMKFPAVFKVSPSLIKITQAFWQLDHGDFSTAMEQLLDPLVNKDDLKDWHHKVALKSLLVQEQYNSALLYMHVRKPPIVDDEDILCALSLFISNKMLDEAFYLEKNLKSHFNSNTLIRHLFAECCRHGCLDKVIHRNLSEDEEKLFLQYLDEVKHPEAADLKITYHMQRSHYIEAFKTYEDCEEDPIKKGLVSQLRSKARDQIIHSYRKLLPTVSYKFIENCRKEPNTGIWKEVCRPEPMSVFVHDVETRTEYKSSLIFAALAKANQTFNGGIVNVSSLMNATTEEIPFLRTPTLLSSRKRSSIQVIVPKVVDEIEEDGPSPKKKMRLSSRSASVFSNSTANIDSSILNTPIISRKDKKQLSSTNEFSRDYMSTPTSILKVKHSFTEEITANKITTLNCISETSNSPLQSDKRTPISGRRSVSRTPIVRFDVPKTSTSSEEQFPSLKRSLSPRERDSRTPTSNDSISFVNSSKSFSRSLTPKNKSDSEDVFYSPNSSLNNVEELPKDDENDSKKLSLRISTAVEVELFDDLKKEDVEVEEPSFKISPKKSHLISEAKLVKLVDYDPSSSSSSSSPRARRSYKKLSIEQNKTRSSPRLRRSSGLQTSESQNVSVSKMVESNRDNSVTDNMQNLETPVTAVSRVKPRKSLSRQVLENNAYSRLTSDADDAETSLRSSFHSEQKEVSSITVDNEKSEFSYSKIEYSDVYTKEREQFEEQHSTRKSYGCVKETALDSEHDTSSIEDSTLKIENQILLSDSFMEELNEDLRRRTFAVNEKKDSKRLQTPEKKTRRLSRRLSAERSTSLERTSQSLLSNNESENEKKTGEQESVISNSPQGTRLSARTERILALSGSSKASASESNSKDIDVSISRTPRKPSAERTFAPNSSQTSSSKSNETEVFQVSSSPRKSIRLSAERTIPPSENPQTSTLLKTTPLRKPIRSLSRQVLENNTYVRLNSEYQRSTKENLPADLGVKEEYFGQEVEEVFRSEEADIVQSGTEGLPISDNEGPNKLNEVEDKLPCTDNDYENADKIGDQNTEMSVLIDQKPHNFPVGSNVETIEENPSGDRNTEIVHMSLLTDQEPHNIQIECDVDGLEDSPSVFERNVTNVNSSSYEEENNVNPENPVLEMIELNSNSGEDDEVTHIDLDYTNSELNVAVSVIEIDSTIEEETTESTSFKTRSNSASSYSGNRSKSSSEKSNTDSLEKPQVIKSVDDDEHIAILESEVGVTNIIPDPSKDKNTQPEELDMNVSVEQPQCGKNFNEKECEESTKYCEVSKRSKEVGVKSSRKKSVELQTGKSLLGIEEICNPENDLKVGKNESTNEKSDKEKVTPSRIMTRRASKLLEEVDNDSPDLKQKENLAIVEAQKSDHHQEAITPKGSNRMRLSIDPGSPSRVNIKLNIPESIPLTAASKSVKTYTRKRTRSVDMPLLTSTELDNNDTSTSIASNRKTVRRRLNSNSLEYHTSDESSKPAGAPAIRRKLRSSSCDFENSSKSVSGDESKRPSSVCGLPINEAVRKNKRKPNNVSKRDSIETYALVRRLTRRQASILRTTLKEVDENEEDTGLFVDSVQTEGTSDPEENKIYDTSPSSSGVSNRIGRHRRLSQSSSSASEFSNASSSVSTSKKTKCSSRQDPTVESRRRLRSVSSEGTIDSIKKSRRVKGTTSADSDSSTVVSTRSKKSAASKGTLETSTKKRKQRSRVSPILPGIEEENAEENSSNSNKLHLGERK
ncbi:hypothetical protein HHI36_005370 [Cryptolaemus montrouzieri]|uniref:Protein ELYS n=1 Tax=Cryptolaemus montrouzieri TaxID=559131 RepID=A0ABD2NV04_9CUCU